MPQPANKTPQTAGSRLSSLLTLLVLLAVIAAVAGNSNRIFDWWRLRGYTPPTNVAQLASDTTMTAQAQHLFFLNRPGIQSDVASFRKDCPENEDTIVLGCYHSVEGGIFVYNVPDPALAGVQQVTAAHETLHAAYDRLSRSDKKTIDAELQDFYNHKLSDQRVKDEIGIYQKTEPKEVTNEMHSIFGTEVANLPTPLEDYYKRYFNDRAKIVRYEQQYQAQFTQRQQAIADDDAHLTALKSQIDGAQSALNIQLQTITSQRTQINALLAAGNYSAYNAAVPSFNRMIDNYNSSVADLQATIDAYNQLVAARNQIATQLNVLDKALDTRTAQALKN